VIQHDVPAQPSRSYQQAMASDSDDDDSDDDALFLTTSTKTLNKQSVGAASNTATDDDDSVDDGWERGAAAASLAVVGNGDQGDNSTPLADIKKQEHQGSVNQAADLDPAISSSEDEELAGFASQFDAHPRPSIAMQSGDMDVVENVHHAAAGRSADVDDDDDSDSDDEGPAAAWQPLPGNHGACKLKAEGIDDVSDFIAEFVHQPPKTTGKHCS